MTVDEQAIITDLMQKNGFESAILKPEELHFQKTGDIESVQVIVSNDFPYYVKTQYANSDVPDKQARQTLMLKNFQKVKTFAENDVNNVINHLKQEFNK